MNRKFLFITATALLTGLAIFWAGEASAQDRTQEPAVPDTVEAVQGDSAEGRRLFVRGITEYEFENYEDAARLLVRAREKMGKNAALDFSIAESFFKIDNPVDAMYYGESAVEQEPGNKWYRILLAEIYQESGRSADSVKQLEAVLEKYPADVDVLYTIARVYSMEGDLEKANSTYHRIMEITGPDMQVFYQMYRNYSNLGDTESAMEQLEGMLELDSDNVAAMQILSQMYAEKEEFEKAVETLERALNIEPNNEETIINLADLYIRDGQWNEAARMLKQVIRNPGVEPFTKVELMQYMLGRYSRNPDNEELSDATRELMLTLLEEESDFGYAHALATEYYNFTGEDDKLLASLEKTNELLPENEPAWRQRLQILLSSDRFEETIEVAREADEVIPDDAFVLYFKGTAYFLLNEYSEAAEALSRAASAPANREFRSLVYGSLGDAYAQEENWEDADEAYEQALRLNPANDVVLNNFAYYLSLREMRLEEALEMSERAVEAEPENAAYLDTLGWVHFKLGNYETAREHIQASVDTGSASAVVKEHLGDVYEKLGDMDTARSWWQKAYEKDNSKDYLLEKIES